MAGKHDDPQVRPVAALWQQLTGGCPLRGEGCPAPEELAAFGRGELQGSRRDALAQLVGNCATCAAGVRVALAADEELLPVQPPSADIIPLRPRSPRPEPAATPRPPAQRWLAGVAAALVLAALAGVWLRTPPPSVVDPRRGGIAEALVPAPEARLSNPVEFRWPAVATDGACRVQLRDGSGALVFESAAGTPATLIAPQPLPPGRYRWTLLCDGAAPRGPHAFTIEP